MLLVLVNSRGSCVCIGRDALWMLLMPAVGGLSKCSLVDRNALLTLQATSLVSCISVESRAFLVLLLPAGLSRYIGAKGAAILMLNVHIASLLCCC